MPGIPRAITTEKQNWQKKMKKKTWKMCLAKKEHFQNNTNHEVKTWVRSECLVGGSEPAQERERDEEECVDQRESEHGAIVKPSKQKTGSSKEVTEQQQSMDLKQQLSRQ